MVHKQALGKGLASLFPGIQVGVSPAPGLEPTSNANSNGAGAYSAGIAVPVTNRDRHLGISLANVDDIRVNPYQPRRDFDETALQELGQSIQSSGIIQPLLVRKDAAGEYQLIAGERRLRAAKMVGLKQVPIVIRKSTDKEALELAIIENIQRQNLNCIDEALAYFQLTQEFSLTQEEVAQRLGKERATVANHLRLLRLPEAIIDDLRRQILSFGHGKVILGLDDNEARLRARAAIVEKRLSVRDAEALVEQIKTESVAGSATTSPAPAKTAQTPVQARFHALAQELTRHWSARVEITGTERRGKITIHYGSRQELDRLLEAMHNQ